MDEYENKELGQKQEAFNSEEMPPIDIGGLGGLLGGLLSAGAAQPAELQEPQELSGEWLTAEVPVKKLREDAIIPTRGSANAAGYDLYACIDESNITIPPHKTVLIGTGLAMEIPDNAFGGIYPRSGLATKKGLRPANCVGVIDSDYRGEIKVALHNDTEIPKIIENKERIAQIIIQTYVVSTFKEVEKLEETERGENGFGSTGTK